MAFLMKQSQTLFRNTAVIFAPFQRAGYAVKAVSGDAGFEEVQAASGGNAKPHILYVQHPNYEIGKQWVSQWEEFSKKHDEIVCSTVVGGKRDTREAMKKYGVQAMPCWVCFKFGRHVENNYLAGEEMAYHSEWWADVVEGRLEALTTLTMDVIEDKLLPEPKIEMPTEETNNRRRKFNKKTYDEWVWGANLTKETILKPLEGAQA
eukprot:TRINITY_DN1642_c0_g1_i2.p2 TRINITY_DN1642_c0_g1~~TRINITY_DN1642_c0_g1_i2.p2  ORF type:complete len:226 (+),score=26.40 TRINITY_DN1642_c0_g1_i2:61-678(+)